MAFYVVGLVRESSPVVISWHRTHERALEAAEDAPATKPTATKLGVMVHEAFSSKDALDIARVRVWAELQRGEA